MHTVATKEARDLTQIKLLNGIYSTKDVVGGKSQVWSSFSRVVDENGMPTNFVSCKVCCKVLTFFREVYWHVGYEKAYAGFLSSTNSS